MNIIRRLTWRYMKQNKSRTLVTIIGVIISVAMLTAVSTLAVSFMDGMKRQTIAQSGEWHVQYHHVDKQALDTIKRDSSTRHLMLSEELGYAHLDNESNKQKPYMYVEAFNDDSFHHFPVQLIEGRLPQRENEIIIPETLKKDYEIGDNLQLELGNRVLMVGESEILDQSTSLVYDPERNQLQEKLETDQKQKFKITGIIETPKWEAPQAPGFTALTYLNETAIEGDQAEAYVAWKDVNKKTQKHAAKLGENLDVATDFNHQLLRYYGLVSDTTRNALFSFAAIIMTVIVIGSVSLIYNAFSISVAERSRYLGMLSSVGATRKQKRHSVYFEGMIIGLVSIPLGVLAGVGGIWLTLLVINPMVKTALLDVPLTVTVTPWSIGVACLIAILTILLSAYMPAKRASKISAIDAIRQTQDIKLTRKKVRTNKLVRTLFGFEAEIALKNLKRNNRKYMATVFSLVISIVLFLSVTYFTNDMQRINDMTMNDLDYDINISQSSQSEEQWDRLVDQVTALDTITAYTYSDTLSLFAYFEPGIVEDTLKEMANEDEDGDLNVTMLIRTLDDASLKRYADEVGFEADSLNDAEKLPAIIINNAVFGWNEKHYDVEVLEEAVQEIKLFDESGDEAYFVDTIHPIAYTDKTPMGTSVENMNALNVIVSEKTYQTLLENVQEEAGFFSDSLLFLTSNDPIKAGKEIDALKEVALHMTNYSEIRQEDEQFMLLMSVFIYGFITLITLITVANIFNTITTSIALRKREFAMLQSMGMTPKGFNKMVHYESVFYGMKSLLYGLPLSIGLMYLMHRGLSSGFEMAFKIPWLYIGFVIIAIFVIVGLTMLYASSKVRKENIIDALKQDNV